MGEPVVSVRALTKVYRVHEREEGLRASLRSIVRRRFKEVPAVTEASFAIGAGEIVGFLGPNGAGKTTTLKMLAGLLYPTAGDARVVGHVPWRRESAFLRKIALLMGNRSQLVWDIPAADSFRVLQEIYRLPEDGYQATIRELTDLLDLSQLLHKPVRNLSLGERMKVEFAAGLLHGPQVAFLDEPTLGLDVSMQSRIRRFVAEWNRRTGATILLTSHYMDDIVALCKRVIVIHHGRLLYDGDLGGLAQRMAPYKVITVTLRNGAATTVLDDVGTVMQRDEASATVHVPRESVAESTARIVRALESSLSDISVEDPPIEEVIDKVFADERAQRELAS